jgi:hypothetical protein
MRFCHWIIVLGLSVDCTVVPRRQFIQTLVPHSSVARNEQISTFRRTSLLLNDAVTDTCNTYKRGAYVLPIKEGAAMFL